MDLITPDFGLIFWQTVTLLAVLLILGKFAWKPILQAIGDREHSIEEALTAADEARKVVAQVEADKAALLKTAHEEREKIVAAAIEAKRTMIEDAQEEAAQEGQKIMAQAKAAIASEREVAVAVLKNQVATLSVQVAQKLLQQELKQDTVQEALVQQLIEEAHLSA